MKRKFLFILIFAVLFINACARELPQPEIPEIPQPIQPQITNPYVSNETTTSASKDTSIVCPKEVIFPKSINPSVELEVRFSANYNGFGDTNFATGLECNDGYVATTNPTRIAIEQGQTQVIKAKVTLSEKECTFKLVETANIDNIIACKFQVKGL